MSRWKAVAVSGSLLTATLTGLEISRRSSVLYQLGNHINSHKSVGSGNCKVVVVSSASDWEKIASDVWSHVRMFPFIGLDCEWVSMGGTPGPVSLLQIATHRGLCVLVRLCQLETVPQSLRQLLVDHDVVKAGVAILDDAKKLLVDYNIDLNGCADLPPPAAGAPPPRGRPAAAPRRPRGPSRAAPPPPRGSAAPSRSLSCAGCPPPSCAAS